MVDKEKVLELFALFADLDKDSAQRYRPFCDAAASILSCRAKSGLTEEDWERLATAAAGFAYCDWLDMTGGVFAAEEIKVGDIAVKSSSGGGKAASAELRRHFEGLVADLLEPAFVFGQVSPEEFP